MRKKVAAALAALVVVALVAWCAGVPCIGAWSSYGMVIDECPDGEPRVVASVSAYGLERNRSGNVDVYVHGSWVVDGDEYPRQDAMGEFDAELSLVDGDQVTPLECQNPWDENRGQLSCTVRLDRELPDGDYILRASIETPLEDVEVDVSVPLYRPAHIHLLTDRPLYEPGDTLQFRALMLRKGTLEPLDERPGTWIVRDPSGTVVYEEHTEGAEWGVVASSFPLADSAAIGHWVIQFNSGDDTAEMSVRVEPFTLPRTTVELHTEDPWYGRGDRPVIEGSVLYNSGAPVADATVEVSLRSQGSWPLPNEWTDLEPLTTDRYGRFSLELPEVPADLVSKNAVSVMVGVTDTDGDRSSGATTLTLSPDPLAAEAVTELGQRLVSDFNNRVYLRVSTPDGRPLTETEVSIRNLWDPRDPGRLATTDVDGVAAFQIDPGQPVNVVVPPQPIRPPKQTTNEPFVLAAVRATHRASTAATIAERRQAEALVEGLDACSHLVATSQSEEAVVETAGGRITRVVGLDGRLGECMADRLEGGLLGISGGLYALTLNLQAPNDITRLTARISTVGTQAPEGFASQIHGRTLQANDCLRGERLAGDSSFIGLWRTEPEGAVSWRWLDWDAQPVPWGARYCIQQAFERMEAAEHDEPTAGTLRFTATPPFVATIREPVATTMQGFEFEISVEDLGTTTWRSEPGATPNFRLRPDKVLLESGEELRIEMLRGPDFSGSLPDQLTLLDSDGHVQNCPRTPKALKAEPYDNYYDDACPAPEDDNAVRFAIPAGREGFMKTEAHTATAIVYVRPEATLSLELSTAEETYAPGAETTIEVQADAQAVVSLVGVDQALGQLAPLPGPDGLSKLAVGATSSNPAWEYMDALALTSGAVRGDNAAMAAVLRVDALTQEDREPPWRDSYGETPFDPNEELQSAFWELLGELSRAVRDWEKTEEGLLTNEALAGLHAAVLSEGEYVDAWGRPLELWRLPDDLLAMCEPRLLVTDATRVPEDIEPWNAWVRKEMER